MLLEVAQEIRREGDEDGEKTLRTRLFELSPSVTPRLHAGWTMLVCPRGWERPWSCSRVGTRALAGVTSG